VNPALIVCPIDFSMADQPALARAISLARWHDAALHVLHVLTNRGPFAAGTRQHALVEQRLRRFVDVLKPAGVEVTAAALAGDPIDAVAGYAREHDADLIVVPQHGRSAGFRRAPGLAAAVGRVAGCPTIAVPPTDAIAADADGLFINIVCAVDFSSESVGALHHALTLAQQSAGRLTLLHVLDDYPYETVYSAGRAFRLIDQFQAHVDRVNSDLHLLVPPDALNWCDVECETLSGIAPDVITRRAAELRADLIVMGLPRRSRLDELFTGSTVKGVLRRAGCPVLIIPAPAADAIGTYLPETAAQAYAADAAAGAAVAADAAGSGRPS
jgi:nucleotide-binding universal stress UspA family protein